jgi:ATP-dependent Lon protease
MEHGLAKSDLSFPRKSIEYIIDKYTRESGVRSLDKTLAKVCRVIAKKVALEEEYKRSISSRQIREILGQPVYQKDKYEGNEYAGVVTGLAWTRVGGDILFVETSISKGKGKLTLTGNLGEVMKESAVIALEYLKSHSADLSIDPDIFENWNFHVHVPEGAIPKDGPSAGVTMATSIASALTQRKVKSKIAMTGEITLRGKVLPVGGIKEKILAAKRAEIKEIILSEENRKDIEEIKEIYLEGLKFHYVSDISQVLEIALLEEKVKNAQKFDT